MSLVSRMRRTISEHRLVVPGDRVAVALSGGPDSVALFEALRTCLPAHGADLAGVVHVNHGLRGADSDADEAFCRAMAEGLGVRCEVEHVDVGALARERRRSLEASAHDARYERYEQARARLGATRLATGHTRNDQAETVLLRLLRGAGRRGLGGIRYRTGAVIRPLLDVTRDEVDEFLRQRGLAYRSDLSNLDRSIPRNRIRHEVLPFLAEKGWSRAVEALASAAALAAEEDAYLDALAAEHGRSIVSAKGGSTLLDVARLTALPPALQRRVVWRALEESAGGGWAGAAHVTRVLALTRRPHGSVELPGRSAERRGGVLVLEPRPPGTRFAPDEAGTPAGASRNLPVPGTVETSDGWSVSARIGSRPPPGGSPQEAAIDAAAAEGGLYVRTRRPGDRFRPLGLGGRKKLQDFFVDRKVPRSERDRVPLVVDGGGRIVWVAGHAIAEEFRVTPQTRGVLLLELRRSGGKG